MALLVMVVVPGQDLVLPREDLVLKGQHGQLPPAIDSVPASLTCW